MYMAFPPHLTEVCPVGCGDGCLILLSPIITKLVCAVIFTVLVQIKSFIRETKRVGDMRTYDLPKRSEKFQHIIYKTFQNLH